MSAYMISNDHAVYLVHAAISPRIRGMSSSFCWYCDGQRRELKQDATPQDVIKVCHMLLDANQKSMFARYPQDRGRVLFEPVTLKQARQVWMRFDPVQVIKSSHCYRYQACEDEGFEASEANAFIRSLIDRCTHCLIGYDDAEWGNPPPYGDGIML